MDTLDRYLVKAKSIDVYDRWLKKRSMRDLNALIRYNQHDVHATAVLIDWLRANARQEGVVTVL